MDRTVDISNLSSSLNPGQKALIAQLIELGQEHLFENWDPPGRNEDKKAAFLEALERIDQSFPGGLAGYIGNARRLLAEAKEGANPFDGFTPSQPDCVDLSGFQADYDRYEAAAMNKLDRIGIVMVAGGLGERLGYPGIKLDIPVEVTETTTYLAHYCQCIKAMEARMDSGKKVPFVIMTSNDTHEKTVSALDANQHFGLSPEQVHLLKQELVPAIMDNDARLALEDTYKLILKPHGHGDIHMLLHTSGTAAKLAGKGISHLLFIQDTNGQVFNAAFAAIGVSMEHGFDMNSLAVNRVAGEAVGGLAKLVKGEQELTLNVEYNQLDPLLRATVNPDGDVAGENGFSLFPGNINVLVIRLASYLEILEASGGVIAEFVNPKYADDERDTFKSPTRLETLMQDLPKLFGPEHKPGVTILNRKWCFSPNKNAVEDAAAKHASGTPPESAATAESDFYLAGRMRLETACMNVETGPERLVQGIPFTEGPRVLIRPSFGLSLQEIRSKIHGGSISPGATLVLDGAGISLEEISLEGNTALVIHAADGADVRVKGFKVQNDGFELVALSPEERAADDTPEYLKIRGYRFENRGAAIYEFDRPGSYTITADGSVQES